MDYKSIKNDTINWKEKEKIKLIKIRIEKKSISNDSIKKKRKELKNFD